MDAPPATIPGTEVHVLHDSVIDQDFEVRIAHPVPSAMGPPAETRDLLVVLDGDLFFGLAVDMTRLMHQLYRELPPIVVVGVGYGGGDPRRAGELRNRDFTPTSDEAFERMGRQMMPDWEPLLPDGQRMGGADAFRRFLVDTLGSFLEPRLGTGSFRRTLFGASLGGLFAAHTFLTEPDAFHGYVVSSPALWWDDGHILDVEKALPDSHGGEARVFFGVGGLEEDPGVPMLARFKLVTNLEEMASRLRRYEGVTSASHVFEGETHTSVVPAVLTRGLRFVCGRAP